MLISKSASHYFKGNRYILNVINHNSSPRVVIKNKKFIEFYVKKTSTRVQREKVFYNWYRNELKIILPEIISKWETTIGVKSNTHKVRVMKTK
jgi:predicted metal-dependent hydrolase